MLRRMRRCRQLRGFSKLPRTFDVNLVTEQYAKRNVNVTRTPSRSPSALRLVLPPPNVTGRLHIGHALTLTIEDAIVRHHRIRGGSAEFIPGFDHAGIATQSVVERELWRREGKTRHDMNREEFVDRCRQWADSNRAVISDQLSRMGATLDWDQCYYTLDDRFSRGVVEAFTRLHGKGMIFRSERIVHWCPHLRTSLSDQEVERVEVRDGAEVEIPSPLGGKRKVRMGIMYTIRYPLEDGGSVSVATTRPETIPADVALAIHPHHPMAAGLVGKTARNPLNGRPLPIVIDEAVELDKGTGILKITPSHDRLDASVAGRHWEEILSVDGGAKDRMCIDERGRMCGGTEFDGIDRFDAREKVLSSLGASSSLLSSSPQPSSWLNICSRSGDILEPRWTDQWFLDCTQLHENAIRAIEEKRLDVFPEYEQTKLLEWFSHSEPWCLSRQLSWGHRIPAYRTQQGEWVVARSDEEAAARGGVERDHDVLDTWFSSSLVPLICDGWMDGRPDYVFRPLSLLETGNDILGFWVARMIIMTMALTDGQLPFPRILLHGLVRDGNGRKMSKSLGNVIDPLDILEGISIEEMVKRIKESGLSKQEQDTACASLRSSFPSGLPRCGPDALRFALLRHDLLAADVLIDIAPLTSEGLKFCNKLWNLTAYAEGVFEKAGNSSAKMENPSHPADAWIVSRLSHCLSTVSSHMDNLSPHLAFHSLHTFILLNLCDVYVEATKPAMRNADMVRLGQISSCLRLVLSHTFSQLSVFLPYVSEFLFERVSDVPIHEHVVGVDIRDPSLEEQFDEILACWSAIRSMKQQMAIPQKVEFLGVLHSCHPSISSLSPVLSDLCSIRLLEVLSPSDPSPPGFFPLPLPGKNAKLSIRVDESHREELIARMENQLKKATDRMEQFLAKASTYDKFAEEEKKGGAKRAKYVKKNERTAEQARNVAQSAREEATRIRKILEDING